MAFNYFSVCSGIEAASVAWHPLGWNCLGVSEIEPFPSAVLAHHYPNVPNFGDMTKFKEWNINGAIDLLVGGTPCASFSVAGLRQGLKDPRGNLMLTFLAIAEHLKPKWILWENVPGVLSSNGGKDFGSFLGGLGELGYGFAYRVLDAQWCRTHRHPRAVPQRRRRVFVVGCAGDHISAAKVLFERESLSRYSAPRRATRQGTAADVAKGFGGGGDGGVPSSRGEHLVWPAQVASTLNASFGDKQGLENQHALNGAPCFVPDVAIGALQARDYKGVGNQYVQENKCIPCWWDGFAVAYSIREDAINNTFSATPTNVGLTVNSLRPSPQSHHAQLFIAQTAPAIAYSFDSLASNSMKSSNPVSGCNVVDVAKCIDTSIPCPSKNQGGIAVAMVNMQGSKSNACVTDDGSSYTINAMHGHDVHAVAVAPTSFDCKSSHINVDRNGVAQTLRAMNAAESHASGGGHIAIASQTMQVRRLTPTECERLQGFPDGWTAIPWKKKPADQCPDGPRYKALGNSMAVNCMEWLGERIQAVTNGN